MPSGTVIFAHPDPVLTAGVERALCMSSPWIHAERAATGREALAMQSLMRADAVVMDMNLPDMPGEHLLHELKRDIVNPYIVVCSQERTARAERQALRMGANSFIPAPIDIMRVCDLIEVQLKARSSGRGIQNGGLAEMMLQRIFMDNGLPYDLKGYSFLKYALTLLNSGEAGLDSMRTLYERIGERYGCKPGAVEHGIRYAVGICWQRIGREGEKHPGNREFIARLLEESRSGRQTLLKPRVSVFCSGRRVFG